MPYGFDPFPKDVRRIEPDVVPSMLGQRLEACIADDGRGLHGGPERRGGLLGMAERMGLALLERESNAPVQWTWSVESDRVKLSTSDAPVTLWTDSAAQDWDTAFLLRRGGIAHAGGSWHFELPLIPE